MNTFLNSLAKYALGGVGAFFVLDISNLIATGTIAWTINIGFALIVAAAWAITDGLKQSTKTGTQRSKRK